MIKSHPKPFSIYSQKLLSQNLVTKEEVAGIEALVTLFAYHDDVVHVQYYYYGYNIHIFTAVHVMFTIAKLDKDLCSEKSLLTTLFFSLQVKKTFDDSFQAAQDPQTLQKYSALKQTPENNWQGFKSWDRLMQIWFRV